MLWVLTEMLLMSTHNICFYGEIEKIIQELSSNTPPQHVLRTHQAPFLPNLVHIYLASREKYGKYKRLAVLWEKSIDFRDFWKREVFFFYFM